MKLTASFLILFFLGLNQARSSSCEFSLPRADHGLKKSFQSKIVKPAGELDPQLGERLISILNSAGLKQVIIELKRLELGFFKAPHRLELTSTISEEQGRFLQANPKFSNFNLAAKDLEKLTLFYANSVKQLMISADKLWREELAKESVQQALQREATDTESKMLATQLRLLNNASGKPETITDPLAVEKAYDNYQTFSDKQTKALVEAFQVFSENPRSAEVGEILDAAGFSWSRRNQIVSSWEMPKWEEWRCCRAGCSDCPINTGVR